MESKRTTKTVTMTITAVFYGDYHDAGDVTGYLQGWIDAGLDDRDDLRSWRYSGETVTEIDGDPNGWDE